MHTYMNSRVCTQFLLSFYMIKCRKFSEMWNGFGSDSSFSAICTKNCCMNKGSFLHFKTTELSVLIWVHVHSLENGSVVKISWRWRYREEQWKSCLVAIGRVMAQIFIWNQHASCIQTITLQTLDNVVNNKHYIYVCVYIYINVTVQLLQASN